MRKRAVITGMSGQDGAYLAQLLLGEGYEVIGTSRNLTNDRECALKKLGIASNVCWVELNPIDQNAVYKLFEQLKPDQIYNLAAPSSVETSFRTPVDTVKAITSGTLNILEAVRLVVPEARFYQASSSEIFGNSIHCVQNEETPYSPESPYAVAKICAHSMTGIYRRYHKLFTCCGILFNHESPFRSRSYVSRKITNTLTRIEGGEETELRLGNIDVGRDFGFAGDYVQAMYLMTIQTEPDDYVIATGESHTIRKFANYAMELCGFQYEWTGTGLEERCIDLKNGKTIIEIDPMLYRPLDVNETRGDSSKAQKELNWHPRVSFQDLVTMMVEADRQ